MCKESGKCYDQREEEFMLKWHSLTSLGKMGDCSRDCDTINRFKEISVKDLNASEK